MPSLAPPNRGASDCLRRRFRGNEDHPRPKPPPWTIAIGPEIIVAREEADFLGKKRWQSIRCFTRIFNGGQFSAKAEVVRQRSCDDYTVKPVKCNRRHSTLREMEARRSSRPHNGLTLRGLASRISMLEADRDFSLKARRKGRAP